jgi:hypothetical protein
VAQAQSGRGATPDAPWTPKRGVEAPRLRCSVRDRHQSVPCRCLRLRKDRRPHACRRWQGSQDLRFRRRRHRPGRSRPKPSRRSRSDRPSSVLARAGRAGSSVPRIVGSSSSPTPTVLTMAPSGRENRGPRRRSAPTTSSARTGTRSSRRRSG